MPPTAVLLLLLWIACRRACCWAAGRGLPSGVRWHFRHFLGTEMELSISSARMLQQLPHSFAKMRTLQEVRLDLNPMRSPPPEIFIKGVRMIKKYCKARGRKGKWKTNEFGTQTFYFKNI